MKGSEQEHAKILCSLIDEKYVEKWRSEIFHVNIPNILNLAPLVAFKIYI